MRFQSIIAVLVVLLIAIPFIGTIFTNIDSANGFTTEEFVAVQDNLTAEVITLSSGYNVGTVSVDVNGVAITGFTETDNNAGTVTLDAAESDTGDDIAVRFQVLGESSLPSEIGTLFDFLPLIIGVGLVIWVLRRSRVSM